MKKTKLWLLGICALVAFGCGGSGNESLTVPDPVVRVINASPDSTALDFKYQTDKVVQVGERIPYLGSSADFISLEPNDYDVIVVEAGNPLTEASEAFDLHKDTSVLTVALGLVFPNEKLEKRLRTLNFTFDRTKPNGDVARIIVINAMNSSEEFSENLAVDLRNPGDTPLINVANIEFGAQKTETIDAGTHNLVVRLADSELEITTPKDITFEAGKIYAVVLSGIQDSTGVTEPKITLIELQSK
jgi:hypothetical protein